ncbi:MAG: signal recognition particle-docking protein FtsY [Ruminococcaceae bacterium]|nr:signal recognition particle-docking protein FtsY [Oscillospiraceae bacterium]
MGFFEKLKEGLKKTKEAVFKQVTSLFSRYTVIDDDLYEELEEILITSDVGVGTTEQILESLQEAVRRDKITEPEEARLELMKILAEMIGEGEPLNLSTAPSVVLVIGVNGVGKTTSIAKIANLLKKDGKKVILAAADTFRAAAIDQIAVWADRVGVELVRHDEGSDPASVVYDAVSAAKSRGADVLIVDTAGRLHNKKNLMDELAKINRVISRELPDAARETLLILDATTGQNAVIQASEFKNAADITGLVLTKLDGTAKGGIVFSIKRELDIPVKFIGVGEQMDDLQVFHADEFVRAMFEE